MKDIHPLLVIVFLPTAVALLGLAIPSSRVNIVKWGAAITACIVLTLVLGVYASFGETMTERHMWISALHIQLAFDVDALSLSMILITSLLTIVALFCSWNAIESKAFYLLMLVLETGMLGVFLATDLFLFYVFWEVTLIPMYFIIGVWGGPRRVYSAVKFIIFTMIGSLFMLVAVVYVAIATGTFDMTEIAHRLPTLALGGSVRTWLFIAFAVAFAVKVPIFPLHTWLPDAHVEAPTAGSVILAGVLLKMGAYGFLRICLPWFPETAVAAAPVFLTLGVVGVVFGAFMAMTQGDIKRLIAYSSVSHLGFVVLAIFSFDPKATQGAVFEMVNHGLSTGALFALVGVIYDKTHRRGVDDFGGLASVMPRYATLFLIATLSSIGLPGLNGFVGELLILLGSFQNHPIYTSIAGLGVIFGAVYMLRLYRNMFFGPVRTKPMGDLRDVSDRELSYLIPLVVGMVLLGVLPNTLLHLFSRVP